jgi:ATPase family associated with various cellular activities (AAA)
VSGIDPQELAEAIQGLYQWAGENRARPEPVVRVRLHEHFGADPAGLPVVSAPLVGYERVNFQAALDAFLAEPERESELIGLSTMRGYRIGLAELAQPATAWGPVPEPGPPEYETEQIGERTITCVAAGLWLIRDRGRALALMLTREDHGPGEAELGLEAMASEREQAEALLAELRELMDVHNVYRGRILTLAGSHFGGITVSVRRLPAVTRDRIVLPAGVLERIERHTLTFSTHAEALRASGRHLKRGLLLHGAPGTGKTLTAMYLSALMPDRTVILLSGEALSLIGPSCQMARQLAPAMIVLEDVDLVALDRDEFEDTSVLLFELLNEMDGLQEDSDIVFVLTTNRAKVLEPALAARPGRIDLAVELPLPDAPARDRLVELYAEGLELRLNDRRRIISATEGTTPAFIRELLRRAALFAAEDGDGLVLTDSHLTAALTELRESGGELTQTLLGARPAPPLETDDWDEDA